ncbi:MAG: (2Fe-2S) ferredoxin domain-containing protein [Planctomycetota bacterium]
MNSPYRAHVFVCTKGKECCKRGGPKIARDLRIALRALGLKKEVRVERVGCLDHCKKGPIVAVYPMNAWYTHVKRKDVEGIVKHVCGGVPYERRLWKKD